MALAQPAARALLVAALLAAACGARSGLEAPDRDAAPVVDAAPDAPPDAPPPASCGNGVVDDPREQCDLGPRNALVPAFALREAGATDESTIAPVLRRRDAVAFYGYESASAHTGFELLGGANLFLYVNAPTNELALFFVAGQDFIGNGRPAQPSSVMRATFRGVPAGARVALSDDPLAMPEFAAGTMPGEFVGRWAFEQNTDGALLTALSWDRDWTITVDAEFVTGVTSWRYIDGPAGTPRALTFARAVDLIHRVTPARCRPDCRTPRCGDGFVDAGERCDDGNTRTGDGCAGDCRRIE